MDYRVRLDIFEGPLDLLLHLIHRNEMDIFDIPIATITDQYLEYLDMMQAESVTISGEFLVMASTLIHIKSKMLLPSQAGEDTAEDDPRVDITQPLLEYMRFRDIANDLSSREVLGRDVFSRRVPSYIQEQLGEQEPELDTNLFQLVDAFKRILDEREPESTLAVHSEEWSVQEKADDILNLLRQRREVFFGELFEHYRSISELVATFLALLELVHTGLVSVFQATPESPIQLTLIWDGNGKTSYR